MADDDLGRIATQVLVACRANGWMVATAESCTGGMIASALTAIAGSSDVFERGFVTYSNAAKTEMLGVPEELVTAHGAVSRQVAEAMAKGAILNSHASVAVSVTGIAGPGGGSQSKPVGLVYLATATRNGEVNSLERHYGDLGRDAIRRTAVLDALALVLQAAKAD